MYIIEVVPPGVATLKVSARWGDYEPLEQEGKATGEWKGTEHRTSLRIGGSRSRPV